MLPAFNEIISGALRLDEAVFAAVQSAEWGLWVALLIVTLAALSEAVGQSIVLFINKVSPRRFWLALCIAAVSHVLGYVFWAATVWLIGRHLFEREQTVWIVATAVGLAYAPRLFSFFILIPFLGNGISLLLGLWSLLATVVAVGVGFDMNMGQAVLTSVLGWGAVQIWQRTLGRPVQAIGKWIDNRAAGVPLRFTLNDIPQLRHQGAGLLELWRGKLEKRGNIPANSIKTVNLPSVNSPSISTLKGE